MKKIKIPALVLPILFFATLLSFSLTQGRYSGELSSGEGGYPSDIEYLVSEQIEVASMEEFVLAIENGYSNIKISDQADGAIIVTAGVAEVYTDLIINLNGHQLIRNSREPMLNVVDGIHLTIVDTSAAKTGAFYNPVGSVLEISGGTLTVTGGSFASGPRAGEYVTDAGSSTSTGGIVYDTLTLPVYVKTEGGYVQADAHSRMPRILPQVQEIAGAGVSGSANYIVNGNMYFPDGIDGNPYVLPDTFLYYTVSRPGVSLAPPASAKGSADFYYRCYAVRSTNALGAPVYTPTSLAGGENVCEVIVWGYNRVAESVTDAPDNSTGVFSSSTPYASIRMKSGNMYVRGGSYSSYFGKEATYGIYVTGGYMAVEDGEFEVQEASTGIFCSYGSTASAEEYLRIAGGSFFSAWGDSIRVEGGRLVLTGGSFVKDASAAPASAAGSAVIRVNNGELDGSGAHTAPLAFSLSGSHLYGIYAADTAGHGASVSLEDTAFAFQDGVSNVGIYAAGGEVLVSDTVFSIPSSDSYGIEAEDLQGRSSDIRIHGCRFVMTGERSTGVSIRGGTVTLAGTETNAYTMFYIDRAEDCYGVLAGNTPTGNEATSAITVNVGAAQFFMGQAVPAAPVGALNGAGVYANADGATVNIGDSLFITSGNGVSGVYAEKGTVKSIEGDHKSVIITGAVYNAYESGVSAFPRGGNDYTVHLFEQDGGLNVTGTGASDSHGIYAKSGTITLGDVFVAIYSDRSSGILSDGGDITVNGKLDIVIETETNAYGSTTLSSTAVATQGGDLRFGGNADILTDSLGIFAAGGSVTATGDLTVHASRGTAIYINGGDLDLGDATHTEQRTDIHSAISETCRWPDGLGYSDGVLVQGGSLHAYGSFEVEHRGLRNKDQYTESNANTLYREFAVRSYAVRVTSGAGTSEVCISAGEITNACGGGIYVEQADTQNPVQVVLGTETDAENTGLTVSTAGTELQGEYIIIGTDSNWHYMQSAEGGHAVEVNGGTLTIYSGTYTALQGEGILVKGGKAEIYDGIFLGGDAGYPIGTADRAGPAASYSFKLFGGEVIIHDGSFGSMDSTGSGAFVMGDAKNQSYATAKIYGGSFVAGGQAGISLYDYADILLSPENNAEIKVSGKAVGIAVENSQHPVRIEIRGGDIRSTGLDDGNYDGLWYSNSNAQLIIRGGSFTGSNRAGIYFQAVPGDVQISGGEFTGRTHALNSGSWVYAGDVLADGYVFSYGNGQTSGNYTLLTYMGTEAKAEQQ